MKFTLQDGVLTAAGETINQYKHADSSLWTWLGDNVAEGLADFAYHCLEVFTLALPDIAALATVGFGVMIMITGKPAKWFGWWSAMAGGAMIWLMYAGRFFL